MPCIWIEDVVLHEILFMNPISFSFQSYHDMLINSYKVSFYKLTFG